MVAAANAELYTPFPPSLVIEDGVQSSEEGSTSDIHSPIFEPSYPDVRYHLGHHHPQLPDASSSFIAQASAFDARYGRHNLQVPGSHLLETLQPPSATVQQLLPPPQGHVGFGLQQQPVLNLALEPPPPIQPPALSPVGEYTFNLPQGGSTEQQMHVVAYDNNMPSSSRAASYSMAPPPEHKPSPPVHISPAVKGNASGNNAQSSASPSRPRREASNVVIACRQCRARKIRCDSTRPHCNNCIRRGNDCEYDAKPKRRGPDKRPGTRQRSCKKRPPEADPPTGNAKKRRKIEGEEDAGSVAFDEYTGATNGAKRPSLVPAAHIPDEASGLRVPQAPPLVLDTSAQARGMPSEAIYPKDGLSPAAQHSPVYQYNPVDYPVNRAVMHSPMSPSGHHEHHIPRAPSFDYAIESWWDRLLDTYSESRSASYQAIRNDITFLLDSSSYWLFFINRPLLMQDLDDERRARSLQPAFVLSALALSTLMRSSELERGAAGRARAVALRDAAQSALEAACSAQRVDMRLAEASIILAIFESSSHPDHSQSRADQALVVMDSIIRALGLTMIDMNDSDVCVYSPRTIPMVYHPPGYVSPRTCACVTGSPAPPIHPHSPPQHYTLSFSFNPPWDPNWSVAEIAREESRRICWSALNLIANYTAQSVAFHQSPLDLYLMEPANYCILFPGEAYERMPQHRIPGQSPKDSVWALYCRSMLLWISAIRPRDSTWTTDERSDFAIGAWTETRLVQDGLEMHKCNLDTAIMYLTREYLYNTRLEITDEFRRLQDPTTISMPPLFNRRQAQEWLYYQEQVARRVKDEVLEVGTRPGHLLTRRPFQGLWYASQVSICLALWGYDHTLMQALELAKTFLIPLDALDALWPCREQRTRTETLRGRLRDACIQAGIASPLPTDLTLPPQLLRPT